MICIAASVLLYTAAQRLVPFSSKVYKHFPTVDSNESKDIEAEVVKQVKNIIELKQQKQTTLPEQIAQLNQRITYTDDKINKLVYESYIGLTNE